MKQRRLPTLWQSYLLQDILVLGLLFFLFTISGLVALSELRSVISLSTAQRPKRLNSH